MNIQAAGYAQMDNGGQTMEQKTWSIQTRSRRKQGDKCWQKSSTKMVDCSQTGRKKDAGEDGGPGIKRDLLATPNRTHHSALASGSAALKFLLELKRPHGLSVSVRLTKAASSSS